MIRFFEIIKKYRTSLCLILLLLVCMVIVPSMAKYVEKDISAGEFNLNVVQNKHVFAVYGDYTSNGTTVKALNFYNRQLVSKGDTITLLDGSKQKVDTIYTGFEVGNNVAPWYKKVNSIKVSRVVDDGIAPESTRYWYKGCENVVDIDLLKLDTSKVTDMSYMFSFDGDAGAVCKYLNLSSFDTSNVTNMSYMFGASEAGTHSLETIIVSDKWNMNKVTESNNMFLLDKYLVGGSGTEYDPTIIDATYARIDGKDGLPGYFTCKHNIVDGQCSICGATEYTLLFDANDGTSAPANMVGCTATMKIPADTIPTRDGYVFLGYDTDMNVDVANVTYKWVGDGFSKDFVFSGTDTTATLYAIWSNNTVSFSLADQNLFGPVAQKFEFTVGMTWGAWVNSDYNKLNNRKFLAYGDIADLGLSDVFYYIAYEDFDNGEYMILSDDKNTNIVKSDVIDHDCNYRLNVYGDTGV